MRKFSYIVILIMLFCNLVYGQNQNTIVLSKQDSADLYYRIKLLESSKESINDQLKNKFDEYKNSNDRQMNPLYIVSMVVIILAGLGMTGYFTYMKKYVNSIVTKRIACIIEEKKNQIVELIRNYEYESILKREKKILLLSANPSENMQLSDFCSKFDFSNVKNIVIDNFKNIETNTTIKESDVIVINNIKKTINDEDLKRIFDFFSDYKNSFIYYGIYNSILAGLKNVNFANSDFTLYSRILETLKTHNILSKS